jgi:predicted dienelactone hydrolase
MYSFVWFALLAFCTLGILLSFALVVGYPLLKLPVPDGPYGIGSVTHALVDSERAAFETSADNGRRLFIKIWYPSDHQSNSDDGSKESLWQDLGGADRPKIQRGLLAYVRSVPTNTISGASFAAGVENPQLLIYGHGMGTWASENTVLMEYLASHGYVVFSIHHLDQFAEYYALDGEVPEPEKERNKALMKRLTPSMGRDEMADLCLELFHASSAFNRMVANEAKDCAYVLNNAPELFAKIPSLEKDALSVDRVGLLGLSLGGAVATEFCKYDERCVAVVNMDGGIYGTRIEEPVPVPYMMMNAEEGEGGCDSALKNATAEMNNLTMPQTKHMDFHDAKLVMPILRWLRVLGKAPSREFMDKKNKLIREHFETYLG